MYMILNILIRAYKLKQFNIVWSVPLKTAKTGLPLLKFFVSNALSFVGVTKRTNI